MSRSIQLLTSAVLAVLLGIAAVPASAGEASATDPAACQDDAAKSEAAMKREAALAELGRRLAAEQQVDPEMRTLNRTGHNYAPSQDVMVQPGSAPTEAAKPN